MKIVKKIGIALFMVCQTIIRLPISFLAMVFTTVDANLIKLHVRLAKELDCKSYNNGLWLAMNDNVVMFESYAEFFEDLQDSLD